MTNMQEHLDKLYKQSMQVSPARLAGIDRLRFVIWLGEWGMKKGAEIGVDKGRFSKYMLENIPDLDLMCVDNWVRLKGESRYGTAVNMLAPFPGAHIVRKTSLEAVMEVPDESLDFVYIDASHFFDDVMLDVIMWSNKVRIGGIVSGHDYFRFRGAGVVEAIDAYTRAHGIAKWFITDEKEHTWFWVRTPDLWEKE